MRRFARCSAAHVSKSTHCTMHPAPPAQSAYWIQQHCQLQGHSNNIVLEASRPEKRRKLSTAEWLSLLDVNVEGRKVTKAQRLNLRSTLDVRGDLGSPSRAAAVRMFHLAGF